MTLLNRIHKYKYIHTYGFNCSLNAKLKRLKRVSVCLRVFYSLPCVCDVGYCWVLILTVRGQWARVLLKPYLIERRIGPNPGQSLLTPALKPRLSGSCVCEAREFSRCFSLCFLQYSAVKWRRTGLEAQWEFDLQQLQLNSVRLLFCPRV